MSQDQNTNWITLFLIHYSSCFILQRSCTFELYFVYFTSHMSQNLSSQRFLVLIASLLLSVQAFTQKSTSKENQQWVHYYGQAKLSKTWTWLYDGGYRWKDQFDARSQYIIRAAASYKINDRMSVSAGFANLGNYTADKISKTEFRPHQDITIKDALGKVTINHRYRVEQRMFHPVVDGNIGASSEFSWRFRYALTATFPVIVQEGSSRGFYMTLSNELFLMAGKDITYNIFDQNRIMISPTYQHSSNLSVALTYNNQFAGTTKAGAYKHVNVLWLQIRHKVDWTKD